MPTVQENRRFWSSYDWTGGGDEWSEVWGGSDALWWGTVFPRLHPFLPTGDVLEIAPGHGRFTQYLKAWCRSLIGVDLAANCVEACRKRFAGDDRLSFHANDGRSLPMVADRSIDFAFSFDSLVHVEIETFEGYLQELARVLRPDAVGFLHHSNVAALRARGVRFDNRHWRAESVSAERVAELCPYAGLACIGQEVVNWGCDELSDCFTLVTPLGSRHERPLLRVDNADFMAEATTQGSLAGLYGTDPVPP